MTHVTDFFDQLSQIWQEIFKFIYSDIDLNDSGQTLSDYFNSWTTKINSMLGDYVHPFFVPYIAFAIVIALVHKFLRLGEKT